MDLSGNDSDFALEVRNIKRELFEILLRKNCQLEGFAFIGGGSQFNCLAAPEPLRDSGSINTPVVALLPDGHAVGGGNKSGIGICCDSFFHIAFSDLHIIKIDLVGAPSQPDGRTELFSSGRRKERDLQLLPLALFGAALREKVAVLFTGKEKTDSSGDFQIRTALSDKVAETELILFTFDNRDVVKVDLMATILPGFRQQRIFPGKRLFILESLTDQIFGDLEVAFAIDACVAAAMKGLDRAAFKVSGRIDLPGTGSGERCSQCSAS